MSAMTIAAPSAANARANARPKPTPAPVMNATLPSNRMCTPSSGERIERSGAPEHQAAVERTDQCVVDPCHLVRRDAPHLADAFLDAVDPVDVGLAEEAAVGVGGQRAVDVEVALGD